MLLTDWKCGLIVAKKLPSRPKRFPASDINVASPSIISHVSESWNRSVREASRMRRGVCFPLWYSEWAVIPQFGSGSDMTPNPQIDLQTHPMCPVRVRRILGDRVRDDEDVLVVEEPLEIQISAVWGGRRSRRRISVTMRTPGHDRELAAGLLFTEGIIQDRQQILSMLPCRSGNRIRVVLRDDVKVDLARLKRNLVANSSCGVCGKTSINAVRVCASHSVVDSSLRIPREIIESLPSQLRAAQAVFDRTGGLHASALFDRTGHLLAVREDVGRHNALDKLIGNRFLSGHTPFSGAILLVSGRVSFELVQKAALAGIPILAAIGAPSSLAVQLAMEFGITLLGFVRDERFNIYCGSERIDTLDDEPEKHPR